MDGYHRVLIGVVCDECPISPGHNRATGRAGYSFMYLAYGGRVNGSYLGWGKLMWLFWLMMLYLLCLGFGVCNYTGRKCYDCRARSEVQGDGRGNSGGKTNG